MAYRWSSTCLVQFICFISVIDEEAKQKIIDQTETNMVALKRTIYLTIQSSLDFEECAHKLLRMELKPGQEVLLGSHHICSKLLFSFVRS